MSSAKQHSVLPLDLLSAFGTHRYYTDDAEHTALMVGGLIEEKDPLFAVEVSYVQPFRTVYHSHEQAQVTYVLSGILTFNTKEHSYIIPPGHMVWLPKETLHAAEAQSDVHFISVYAENEVQIDLPQNVRVIAASNLLKSIFEKLIAMQLRRQKGPIHDALILLLFHEIAEKRPLNISVPMPLDPRLQRICEKIIRHPSAAPCKDELARLGNISVRTMSRLFNSQLKMTFSDWVQRVLIMAAISRLTMRGASVTNVAAELGYESPSAFTAMFRRQIGLPPSDFLNRMERT